MVDQPCLTLKDLPSLKLHIQRAKEEGESEFQFTTHAGGRAPLYVPYAEYVVQYLESQHQYKPIQK